MNIREPLSNAVITEQLIALKPVTVFFQFSTLSVLSFNVLHHHRHFFHSR